ncbi:GyrI-like domain-containing protein [Alisedimentitalea sp. MJ-SS2]|uniref:GyrI-like domain-containing protein n=1 Tax=Aliisedimentitalea sp. MJ-SS2 TaxID=3049795 RepID=UPI002909ED94|nr:GyrI-like domain-containing protein [Alisedimentitalea sp. MJ-SS2]MDU8927818.1 GyrI-like domain-containing protein [Alisedimentitalea sp. MJ-SS2]
MTKLDFKKTDKTLYAAKTDTWARIDVPEMTFLMIDGQGDPNGPDYGAAVGALYPLAYGVKFAEKADGRDFAVPPLEALWWADDPAAFVSGDRKEWRWTAILRLPDRIEEVLIEAVRETVLAKQAKKKGGADSSLIQAVRLDRFTEGDCLQRLHIGPYTDEAPTLAELHEQVMPDKGLTFGGKHHEIYLSDPRRVAPEKLKTILRQPVRPL